MNDSLGAAVAREVVRVIREDRLIERGCEIGSILLDGLEKIKQRTDRIIEVRARGLMVAIELKDDQQSSFTAHIHRELVKFGYILAQRPGLNVLRLDPSLTIDRKDIETFLKILEKVVTKKYT